MSKLMDKEGKKIILGSYDPNKLRLTVGESHIDIQFLPPLKKRWNSFEAGEIVAIPTLVSNNAREAILLLRKFTAFVPTLKKRGVSGIHFETSNKGILKRIEKLGIPIRSVSPKVEEETRLFYQLGVKLMGFSPSHLRTPVKAVSFRIPAQNKRV